MREPISEETFNARMTKGRDMLLFSKPLEIEAEYQSRMAEEGEYLNRCRKNGSEPVKADEYFSNLRERTLEDLNNYLSDLAHKTKSFPCRHALNLKTAMDGNHPQWRIKFDGILERLGSGSIFILHGPRGTGKTQMAMAAARHRAEVKNQSSYYIVLGDLFTEIKGTFKTGSNESEAGIIDRLSCVSLLVLDECHEISGTEWQGRILTLLIDARYRERLDTVLITNQTPESFITSVGESVADRIAECGYFIECNWPSFRRART